MRIKRFTQNLLLLAAATASALLIGELVVRTIKPVYDYRDRCLLFSSQPFKLYSGGAVRYVPNARIREAAVYNGKIEYDVWYATNNLGFVDTKDYGRGIVPGKRYYAFVGDSFTTGVTGGSPWVPALRNNGLRAEVYNFGVEGAGFEHFHRLLHGMKGKVPITHIVLVAITDDFFRGYWHPLEIDGKISFCSEGAPHAQCQPVPIAVIIPPNTSADEVRTIAKKQHKEIRARVNELNAADGIRYRLESLLYDDSAIYYYSKVFFDTYHRSHEPSNIDAAMESMRKIRSEYPATEIHLVHLPQKYEVKTGHYAINIAGQVADLGISYFPALEKCNWSGEMFLKLDGHPNRSGYENIAKCVSAHLFEGGDGPGLGKGVNR